MNQEHDKELDILLRRQAKSERNRKIVAMSFNEENGNEAFGVETSVHLDADAMNAYAENALPQPTRVRYAEHLISCDACRQLVTQLALTANPIAFEKKENEVVETISPVKTWGEWFSSFFTLPTLKVAGPIAAVLCFAAITFVALQRSDLKESTSSPVQAQKENASYNSPDGAKSDSGNVESGTAQKGKTNGNSTTSNTGAAEPDNKTKASSKSGEPEEKVSDETSTSSTNEERTDASKRAEGDKSKSADAQPSPVASQQPSGPAVANQQNTVQETGQRQTAPRKGPSRNNQEAKLNRDRSNQAENTASGGATASKPDAKPKDAERKAAKSSSTPPSPVKKQTVDSDDEDEKLAKSESAANTRSVEGKQFIQKGSAWVDEAFKGGSTTNIKRGSDEYNKLDTGLRSICEKLGGELIVVWKSKAYKIY